MSHCRSIVTVLAGVVLAGAALAGCTGSSSSSGGGSSPDPAPVSGSAPGTGKDVSAQYLSVPSQEPIAGADGAVPGIASGSMPVRFDVLALTVRGGSTVLRARLSSSSAEKASPSALALDRQGERLTGVTLVSAAGDQQFRPAGEAIGTAAQRQDFAPRCACSAMPQTLTGGGVEVSVQYGALPAAVTSVQLKAPGFPAFAVPVTRG